MSRPPETRGLYTQKRARGAAWYFSRMVGGVRTVVNLETDDLGEAIRRRKAILDQGELTVAGTLSTETARYVQWQMKENGSSEFTEKKITSFLKRLVAAIGDIPVVQVTPDDAVKYHASLMAAGLAEESVRTYIGHARTFFQWCISPAGMIRSNPFAGVKLPEKKNQPRQIWVRPWDSEKLIKACGRDDLTFVLYCGFHAGMRRNEIVHARPDWFDLRQKLIHITLLYPKDAEKLALDPFTPKDKTERTMPLSDEFATFLDGYLVPGWDYCIGQGIRRRRSVYRYDFRRMFEEFMEDQKFDWCTIHTMRHSFISTLYSSGEVTSAIIAEWTGDEERTLDAHYKHLLPRQDLLQRAFKSFGKIGRPERPKKRPLKRKFEI